MTTTQFDIGDELRVSVRFYDSDDVDRDPTVVTFKLKNPSEELTTYVYGTDPEVVKDSVGNYHFDLIVEDSGRYHYRWEGTGALISAEESIIHVRRSCF